MENIYKSTLNNSMTINSEYGIQTYFILIHSRNVVYKTFLDRIKRWFVSMTLLFLPLDKNN